MHIILDANVYSSDYRMSGVSFRTLFEYIRRTESRLVLHRLIREEVVLDYGRRLKAEAKVFAEVWNKYRHVDPSERSRFSKPDIKRAMIDLRRRLMKPTEVVEPTYVGATRGVSVDEVFMRGARRTRPANQQGEELRDVIIWLWTIAYSHEVGVATAFISNDSAFWTKEGVHPEIQADLEANKLVTVHRSIDDFAKQHAPAPAPVTEEWLHDYFHIQAIEGQLIDRAGGELQQRVLIRDLTLERYELVSGDIYDVGPQTQFAELHFNFVFKFVFLGEVDRPFLRGLGSSIASAGSFGLGGAYLSNINSLIRPTDLQPEEAGFLSFLAPLGKANQPSRELHCVAKAAISIRRKGSEQGEISIDGFTLDRSKLELDIYQNRG